MKQYQDLHITVENTHPFAPLLMNKLGNLSLYGILELSLTRGFSTRIDPTEVAPTKIDPTKAGIYLYDGLFSNPFTVGPRGVYVTTWQSDGISRYLGISKVEYLLLQTVLGLMQWRVLALNPLIHMNDFVHLEDCHCLFAPRENFADYALLADDPCICGGCRDFYHCLGADSEFLSALCVIQDIRDKSGVDRTLLTGHTDYSLQKPLN